MKIRIFLMVTLTLWVNSLVAIGSETEGKPVFRLSGEVVLSGDRVDIQLIELNPRARVTITAERRWGVRSPALHRSVATFIADDNGVLDLNSATPVTASWKGVDPRGLFWSMVRTGEDPPASWSNEQVHFSADIDGDSEPDIRTVVRLVPGVDGLEETPLGQTFPGAFLLRIPGESQLPAIIVLGGSEGGDGAARRYVPRLASRGFAVVGLPYYSPAYYGQKAQFPDLPRAFHDIPLDRLEGVCDWLRERQDILRDRIGLFGVSKGAEFALAGASRIDCFAAVVAYVPGDVIWEGWGPGTVEGRDSSFSWQGEPLPFVPYQGMSAEIAKLSRGEPARMRTPHDSGRSANPHAVDAARIRVEEIDEPVFIVGGDSDNVWDSGGMARNILAVRKRRGLTTIVIVDPDAGHRLSGDGYSPIDAAEARVQGQAFPAMLRFLERYLCR